ncbi:hypothetical protein C8J57DRAFT_1577779 [Mycena rebaudengoi]|nr:hypothetical protein C8J57DRAFT_1577779 [Mycena rebaudengoi]
MRADFVGGEPGTLLGISSFIVVAAALAKKAKRKLAFEADSDEDEVWVARRSVPRPLQALRIVLRRVPRNPDRAGPANLNRELRPSRMPARNTQDLNEQWNGGPKKQAEHAELEQVPSQTHFLSQRKL